jgi:hypothetical protein
MVWIKGSGFVLLGLIAMWSNTCQNWDKDYVASLNWWNWSVIIGGLVGNVVTNIMSFISKTYATEVNKTNGNGPVEKPTVIIDALKS